MTDKKERSMWDLHTGPEGSVGILRLHPDPDASLAAALATTINTRPEQQIRKRATVRVMDAAIKHHRAAATGSTLQDRADARDYLATARDAVTVAEYGAARPDGAPGPTASYADRQALAAFDVAADTRIGGRLVNMDRCGWARPRSTLCRYMIAAIADGLGSEAKSEVIAAAAVEAVCQLGIHTDHETTPDQLVNQARKLIPDSRRWIDDEPTARVLEAFTGDHSSWWPDSTLVAATITPDAEIHVGWVGDSRAWVLTMGGDLHQLTTDHNYADSGRPDILNRSLASAELPDYRDWGYTDGRRAQRVLLTTDGVHELLDRDTLCAILASTQNSADAARELVQHAVEAGGPRADNATALVISLPAVESRRNLVQGYQRV